MVWIALRSSFLPIFLFLSRPLKNSADHERPIRGDGQRFVGWTEVCSEEEACPTQGYGREKI